MDNTRDVRREFSRSNKKQHQLLVAGFIAEESRREKVRRLSTFGEMGSDDAEATPRKFKLPKTNFADSNTVDPVSVPRKLRSAINKRRCESSSVPLQDPKRLSRLVNTVEPLRKDCLKKLSMNSCLDHSRKRAASLPISKEEEEVAETLFALAGMIPLNDIHMKDKMDIGLLEAKALSLAEKHEDPMPAPEDSSILKEEPEATCLPVAGEDTSATQTANRSPIESVPEKSQIEHAPLSWSNLSERRQLNLNLKVPVPPLNLQTIPPLLRTCDQKSWIDSTFFHTSTEPSQESGLRETKPEKPLVPNSGSHLDIGAVDVGASQERQLATSIHRSSDGLPSKTVHGSRVDEFLPPPSGIIFPSLLNTATPSSKLRTRVDTVLTDKVSCSTNGRGKSWKKCAAHVYICHLIQVMQDSEGKDFQPQFSIGGLVPPEHSNTARNEINGKLTAGRINDSAAYMNACEAANDVSVTDRSSHEREDGLSLSGCRRSKKQRFDFLSLSAGVGSVAGNGVNKMGDNMETAAKSHVFYLHSIAQHSIPLPFCTPKNRLPSNSYRDQVSAISGSPSTAPQVHLQVPPYYGNRFNPAHTGSTTTTVQQLQLQPNQQQQQIWTAQLPARFRPGPLLSSHIANWQTRTQDLWPSTQHLQTLPLSQPSPDALGAKYLNITQQAQLMTLGPLLPPARAKPQHSQLPSICEDNGGRFRPEGVLPLQLLCNERR